MAQQDQFAFETLVDVYEHAVRTFTTQNLFGEKKNGHWHWMTYARFAQRVNDLRGGLAQLGIKEGDKVAVISSNRSEWAIGAYATYGLVATYVPMYEAQQDKEWEYILQDCGAKVVFVANDQIAERVQKFRSKLPSVEHVVRFSGRDDEQDTFAYLCKRGAQTPAPLAHPKPTDLAGLIYTSGTTGIPKGVMLSHSNQAKNVVAFCKCFPTGQDDRSLSFLPWAHSFGQTVELHGMFALGASMGIVDVREKLLDYLGEVRPTVLFAVPMIFNRIYDGLQKRMASESAFKRKLFAHGLKVSAQRRMLAERGQSTNIVLDIQHTVLDRVVFSKVRARFGGRLKYAVTGGAAMAREVAEFIDDLGIKVYEGYGLTETSPIFTANFPGHRKMGSVGLPIPGTRIEIDKNADPAGEGKQGEIIAHGHNVMVGYYNLPDENSKVLTPDGGLRTGDLGYVDADGFLFITGRVKEQYKLENGKYVTPAPIEQELVLSPFITNGMVCGANKPFNVAVIVADMDALKKWATERNIPTDPVPQLFSHPEVQKLFADQIREHTKIAKGYERPQKFLLTSEEFSVANDLLTPKMSIKRRNVVTKYQDGIEALYRDGASASASASANVG